MHPAVRDLVVLNTLDASSELLFGLMQVQPSPARKTVLDTFIKTLKGAGIWQKLDLLYVLAAHDAQAARLNWIDPARFALTVAGSPTFTADQGYTGNGSDASLTATGYNPSSTTGKLVLNDALIGCFIRTAPTANIGQDLNTGNGRLARGAASYQGRINDGTSITNTPAAYTGHWAIRRTASNARALWKDGASAATDTQASTSVSNVFRLFSAGASSFGDAQISVAYAGASLDDTGMAAMNTAIAALKTGIGF